MKILITIFTTLALMFFVGVCQAMVYPKGEEAPELKGRCPKTQVVGDVDACLRCHVVGNFAVKETVMGSTRVYPTYDMAVLRDAEGEYGYFLLKEIEPESIKKFFDYLDYNKVERATIEIYSPGGSLFGAWRIIGIIESWKVRGVRVKTIVNGLAASAGFLIFLSGDERLMNPYGEIMWHELRTFAFIKISSPADTEDEAKVLRHLQSVASNYIATRSKLTKEEIDELVYKKELWISGKEALEYGFATGLVK